MRAEQVKLTAGVLSVEEFEMTCREYEVNEKTRQRRDASKVLSLKSAQCSPTGTIIHDIISCAKLEYPLQDDSSEIGILAA